MGVVYNEEKRIPVLYYDDSFPYEQLPSLYEQLKKRFPNLVLLPNKTKLQMMSAQDLKAIKQSIENIIEFLED